MRKYLLLTMAMPLFVVSLWAQGPEQTSVDQAPNILPPSPTAAELGKYGLVPVGMATGTPNVEIPLHVFRTRNLSLPISLSYSSGGVKVDQVASWVGLNFSLNAGGMVSRIVRGGGDEENLNNGTVYEYPENFAYNNPEAVAFIERVAMSDGFDTQPDLFVFNFAGASGKFVYDKDGNEVIMPHQNIAIERYVLTNSPGLGYFVITDASGIVYTFSATETSKTYQFGGCGRNYDGPKETAWYLTKIEHPLGDVIHLEYDSYTYMYSAGVSQTLTGKTAEEPCPGQSASGGTTFKSCESRILTTAVHLSRIYADNHGSIEFHSSRNRLDLSDYKLDSLTIRGTGNEALKSVSLEYVFATSNNTYANTYSSAENKRRMFLQAVVEHDRLGAAERRHTFEYNDMNGLPPRLSFAQDHWGMFNGKDNNDLMPVDNTKDNMGRYMFENYGGDKEPNATFAQKGLLSKIIYPTGGFTQFNYEGNTYYGTKLVYPGKTELRLQAAVEDDGDRYDTTRVERTNPTQQTVVYHLTASLRAGYEEDEIHSGGRFIVFDNTDGSVSVLDRSVNIDQAVSGSLELIQGHEYTFELLATGEGVNSTVFFDYYATAPQPVVGNVATGGVRIASLVNHDPLTNNDEQIRYYYSRYNDLTKSSGKIGSAPQYQTQNTVRVPCELPCESAGYVNVVLSSNTINSLFSPSGNNIYYEYVTVGRGPDLTQGVEEHTFIINFDYVAQQVWGNEYLKDVPLTNGGWNNGMEKLTRFFKKTDTGFVLLKSVENVYVQDPRRYNETPGLVVRKRYSPSCYQSATVLCDGYNTTKEYTRLVCVAVHDHKYVYGGNNRSLEQPRYCLAAGHQHVVQTYSPHPCYGKVPGTTETYPMQLDHVDAMEYKTIQFWHYLKQKVETTYDENGLNPVVQTVDYEYENPVHAQVSKVATTGSDGKVNETRTRYTFDYLNVGNIEILKNKNIHVPIKIERTVDGNQVGGNAILYTDLGQPSFVYRYDADDLQPPAAHNESVLVPAQHYALRLEYTYQTGSNVVKEVKTPASPTKSYIWGYNQTLPVAEVVNATADKIFYADFENASGVVESTGNPAHTGRRYRNSGSYNFQTDGAFNPAVTTGLVMSYWYWASNTWNYSGTLPFSNSIAQGSRLDDIRVHPADAHMVTLTHDPLVGVTSSTDANGVSSYFEYDAFGRLNVVRDRERNVLSTTSYNYQKSGVAGLDKNFVVTRTVQVADVPDAAAASALPVGSMAKITGYMDGLGRPAQTITWQGSPDKKDVVQPVALDALGREAFKYLPYVSSENTGAFKSNPLGVAGVYTGSAHFNFYNGSDNTIAQDQKPYAETIFELSPLDRPVKQGAPGIAGQPQAAGADHSVKMKYLSNGANDVLNIDYSNATGEITYLLNGSLRYYEENTLTASVSQDEHNYEVIEYKDKQGQLLVKKVQVSATGLPMQYAETYYVYDDFGNLVVVLPPEAVSRIKSSTP